MSTEPVTFAAAIPASGRTQAGAIDTFARILSVAALLTLILVRFRPLEGAALQAMALSIAAAIAVQISYRPRPLEIAITALIAAGAATFYMLGFGGARLAPISIVLAASLGVGAMLVLGAKAAWSTAHLKPFLLAAFCPLMVVFTTVSLTVAAGWTPLVFDGHLYQFEGSLGFQPSFLLGQAFLRWHAVWIVALWVYGSLPLALVLMFIALSRRSGDQMAAAVKAVVLTAFIGFALYQICPAIGPAYRFPLDYPFQAPNNVPVAIAPADTALVRNAMPSLHIAWAFLLLWNLRREPRWLRWAAAVYFAITVAATMGFGEHYAVDVVVGLPVALAMQCCAVKDWRGAAGAFSLVAAWLLYFRYGVPLASPPAPLGWIPVGASLTLCAFAAFRLDRRGIEGAAEPASSRALATCLDADPSLTFGARQRETS